MSDGPVPKIYQTLYAAYGPQHWWPGESPLEVAVGALLTQNTNWTNVEKAIANLKAADMLDAGRIIACERHRLETLIRPSGFFRQKAGRLQRLCRFWLERDAPGGLRRMPTSRLRQDLLALHGIGPETADSILLYALERPVFVIDAYTRRIFARLGLTKPGADYQALQDYLSSRLPADTRLFNEFHALLVTHAKRHCRSRPRCQGCPLAPACRHDGERQGGLEARALSG